MWTAPRWIDGEVIINVIDQPFGVSIAALRSIGWVDSYGVIIALVLYPIIRLIPVASSILAQNKLNIDVDYPAASRNSRIRAIS